MKTLKLITAGLFLFVSSLNQAQVSVSVNFGSPPSWGPSGYSNIEYYYLPDIQAYYDVRASQFIYLNNGRWIRSRNLPGIYRNYDLYNGYKVVLKDYHGSRPYTYFKDHKTKYYKGYKGTPQRSIGKRDDNHGNNDNRMNNNPRGNNDNRENNDNHGNDNKNRGNDNKDHGNERH